MQPGRDTLQAAHDAASAGDELVLADGYHTGSSAQVVRISKSITIRALNPGMAVLDGENARRVVHIRGAPTVILSGLNITRGSSSSGAGLHVALSTATLTAISIYSCAASNVVRLPPHN